MENIQTTNLFRILLDFSQLDNPQLLSLIILDEPKQPYHWGGQGAAVAFKRIMKRIISMDDSISPPIKEKSDEDFEIIKISDKNKLIADLNKERKSNSNIISKNKISEKVEVPELRGLSMRKAMITLNNKGILSDMSGSGKVIWQSPKPGTLVKIWNYL